MLQQILGQVFKLSVIQDYYWTLFRIFYQQILFTFKLNQWWLFICLLFVVSLSKPLLLTRKTFPLFISTSTESINSEPPLILWYWISPFSLLSASKAVTFKRGNERNEILIAKQAFYEKVQNKDTLFKIKKVWWQLVCTM